MVLPGKSVWDQPGRSRDAPHHLPTARNISSCSKLCFISFHEFLGFSPLSLLLVGDRPWGRAQEGFPSALEVEIGKNRNAAPPGAWDWDDG